MPSWVGLVEPLDAQHCSLTIGGDTAEGLAGLIVQSGVEFTLLEPAELAQPLAEVAARLLRGVRAPENPRPKARQALRARSRPQKPIPERR